MVSTKKKKVKKNNGGNNKVADKPIGDQKGENKDHCCYGDLCGNAETPGTLTLIDRDHQFTVRCQSCNGYFHKFGCGNTITCKKCDSIQKPITDDTVDDEVPVNLGSNVGGVAGKKGGTSKKYLRCMFLLRIDFYLFATINCVAFFFHFKGHLRMDF